MSKKIKPLGNRVVVKRADAKQSKGGILLPETAKEKPREGKVVAVGPGKLDSKGKLEALDVKVGDKVLFSSYSGVEYKADNEEYLILTDEDLLAVLGE